VRSVTIDGEVVVCRPNGKPDFDKLHSRVFDRIAVMIAFDLIELNGKNWAMAPLEARKARLAQLLRLSSDIHYNQHFDCEGETLLRHACKLKLEGIVSNGVIIQIVRGNPSPGSRSKIQKALRCSEYVMGPFEVVPRFLMSMEYQYAPRRIAADRPD
jgi:bifunctional non-homologous end joining protein LigD